MAEEFDFDVETEAIKGAPKEGILKRDGGFFKKHKTGFLIGASILAGAAIGAAGAYANTISEQDYHDSLENDPDYGLGFLLGLEKHADESTDDESMEPDTEA